MTKTHFIHLSILTGIFVLVNGLWFWKMGIMTDDDTWGYLQYADEIKENGMFFKPHLFWYIGYVLFILGANSIIPGFEGIVVFQYVFAYAALIAMYFASINLYQNPKAALLTCIWFLGFIMISFWNLFLYAESLMISLYCISFFFLSQAYRGKLDTFQGILAILVMIWAIMVKPTGVALLAGLVAVAIAFAWKRISTLGWKLAFSTTLIVGLLVLVNQMLGTFGIVEAYQNGEVVYNIHKMAHMDYASSLMLTVPNDLSLPAVDWSPLGKMIYLWIFNPLYSLQLFGTKLFYYLMYVRPYYSWVHNIIALCALIPMYFAFFQAIRGNSLGRFPKIFSLTLIGCSALSVALLSDNWNSRFLMPVLPLVFLVGGNVISRKVGQNKNMVDKLVL
ncbi:hypothetical protein [Cognataquiflexum aquatile]|uniref:hypothetical protein n=1 Tax=Cognataquiflexum aquatile TaxID=2249427 RepID=UPI000DEBFB53|nr:hypothetical protein [Cognataquiflexum aquatile]